MSEPKSEQSYLDEYSIADWKWEFLRRNPRYRKACTAVEWLKKRARRKNTSAFFRGFGLREPIHFLNLFNKIRWSLGLRAPKLKSDSPSLGESFSLPSPELASHEFKFSPVSTGPIVDVYNYKNYKAEGISLTIKENELVLVIDTRSKVQDVVSEVKENLRAYQSQQRDQVRKYKDYLAVWDLRQQGRTADKIAPLLWPEEHEEKGGRDAKLGEKGALVQRVYDHESAAQKLIDETFPPRKTQPPTIQN